MLITNQALEADKELSSKIKGWAAQLNLNAKKPGCKTFKVNGPRVLTVRGRMVKSPRSRPFIGNEEFCLSSIFIDRSVDLAGFVVSAIFCPVGLELAAEFGSATVLLSDAVEVFSGFEEWVDVASVVTVPEPAPVPGVRTAALPSVEETRASEIWGAW